MSPKIKKYFFMWDVIGFLETVIMTVYRIFAIFAPALIVDLVIGNGLITSLVLLGSIIRLCHSIFKQDSIKNIYLRMRWIFKHK